MAEHPWVPDWVVAPAETLQEWLDDHDLTPRALARTCGEAHHAEALAQIQAVLNREAMSGQAAAIIARCTQTSALLCLALEHNYRAGLARGLPDTSGDACSARDPSGGERCWYPLDHTNDKHSWEPA